MSFGTKKHLIIHDYFENFGGGERLIQVLYKTNVFDLIYGFDKDNLIRKINLHKNSLNLNKKKIPAFIKKTLLKKNFENLNIKKKYETCIMSGNYSVFSKTENFKKKIFYCHSLPKLFFEFNKFYKKNNIIKKLIYITLKKKFIKEYYNQLKLMDLILCNSLNIKKKIKKFTKLNAKIIYPPIEVQKFKWISQKKYFVSNNRHVPEKNIEKIIAVFKNFPNYKVYITSTGHQTNYLKKLSKNFKNIIFTGFLNEKKYSKLIGNCTATINISSNEDFGMAALEGLAAGKPAIVTNEGGYLETIKENYNGFFFNKKNLIRELTFFLKNIDFKKLDLMKKQCQKSVEKYSCKNFVTNIKQLIKV